MSRLQAERGSLVAEVTDAVLRETALSGGGVSAVASLEDKVKECGRLILRMGGDLMEEAKSRQAVEAEMHELRMRLSSVEAVSRSPIGMPAIPHALSGGAPDYYPMGGGAEYLSPLGDPAGPAFPWPPFGNRQASVELAGGLCGSVEHSLPAAAAAAAGHLRDLQAMGLAPPSPLAAGGRAPPSGIAPASPPAPIFAGGRVRVASEVLGAMAAGRGGEPPPPRPEAVAATWTPAKDAAIDDRLARMAAPREPLSASASYAALVARGVAPPLTGGAPTPPAAAAAIPGSAFSGSAFSSASFSGAADRRRSDQAAPSSSSAAALRMTREQLDARVQQILGKHGGLSTAGPRG